jgi:hypothetical protein
MGGYKHRGSELNWRRAGRSIDRQRRRETPVARWGPPRIRQHLNSCMTRYVRHARADPRQFVLGGEDGHMKNHPSTHPPSWWSSAALDGNARALLLHHAQPPSTTHISQVPEKEPWIGSDVCTQLRNSRIHLPPIPLACIYSGATVLYLLPRVLLLQELPAICARTRAGLLIVATLFIIAATTSARVPL